MKVWTVPHAEVSDSHPVILNTENKVRKLLWCHTIQELVDCKDFNLYSKVLSKGGHNQIHI